MSFSMSMSLSQRHAQAVGRIVSAGRASFKVWSSSLRRGSSNSSSGPLVDAMVVVWLFILTEEERGLMKKEKKKRRKGSLECMWVVVPAYKATISPCTGPPRTEGFPIGRH
jgi:hypothetical protein